MIGWSQIKKLLGRRRRTDSGCQPGDTEPRHSAEDVAHEVAKQEKHRLAILRDYGRTLGY
jgi:hypothetical protein